MSTGGGGVGGGQDQPIRPDPAIRYGQLFSVSGELAYKPVTPQDAALMQSAECTTLGHVPSGSPGDYMRYAAEANVMAGVVAPGDVTDTVRDGGIAVTATDVPGARLYAETIAGQVVSQYMLPTTGNTTASEVAVGGETKLRSTSEEDSITIGEALEATAVTRTSEKPITQSDAAAIEEAEKLATGRSEVVPGGIASLAHSAAILNETAERGEGKVSLGDVLQNAAAVLPGDKKATREVAEKVVTAEMHASPNVSTRRAGVGTAMVAAARINEQNER